MFGRERKQLEKVKSHKDTEWKIITRKILGERGKDYQGIFIDRKTKEVR